MEAIHVKTAGGPGTQTAPADLLCTHGICFSCLFPDRMFFRGADFIFLLYILQKISQGYFSQCLIQKSNQYFKIVNYLKVSSLRWGKKANYLMEYCSILLILFHINPFIFVWTFSYVLKYFLKTLPFILLTYLLVRISLRKDSLFTKQLLKTDGWITGFLFFLEMDITSDGERFFKMSILLCISAEEALLKYNS